MTLVIARLCRRCGGACKPWAPDGELVCILCARPCVAPQTAALHLVREDTTDIDSMIERDVAAVTS